MPGWAGSDRRDRLPDDWEKRRKFVLKRDNNECQAKLRIGGKCRELATDVDHVDPGDDHSPENLQALCDWHHKRKSGLEGAAAVRRKRAAIKKKYRRTETHPGLL
jgi:5-methylcytosine-specific restriction endonuclease McrA